MRIRFCVLAVLAALSVGVTAWTHGVVYAQREAVVVEQRVIRGDPALAEGVFLEMRTGMDRHLFWETRITVGTEVSYDTDYTFSPNERRNTSFRSPQKGLRLDVMGNSGPTDQEWETEDKYGMQKPYNDVASRCPAGVRNYTETVYLRDYYEVYPLYLQNAIFELLPASFGENVVVIDAEEDQVSQLQSLMRAYFPIPVSGDAVLEINMDKNADGEISAYGSDVLCPFEVYSVLREEGIYFVFSSVAGETPLDTSRFPLGYGVYFLPVNVTLVRTAGQQRVVSVSFGEPVCICPVDAAVEYAWLCGGETGDLYLFTQLADCLTMTVVNQDSGCVQVLPLLEKMGEDDRLADVRLQEDHLLVRTWQDRFRVAETAGGTCRATLEGSFRFFQEEGASLDLSETVMDYAGERLAVVGADLGEKTVCYLALYGEEGLTYLGEYTLSQNREIDCRLEEDAPLTVRLPGS